jgi:hypothetical protein
MKLEEQFREAYLLNGTFADQYKSYAEIAENFAVGFYD